MTDTPRPAAGSGLTAPAKARRGRRIMVVVLGVLILLLGLSSYLFYRIVSPPRRAAVAGADASASGLEWVRSIYGRSNRAIDQFSQTQAAVPAADGTIWVTDTTTRQLQHFTADGRYLGSVNSREASSPLLAPSRLAIGPDGLIYICETAQGKIRVLRPDGTDEGFFTIPQPVSIAVSSDRIVVGAVAGFAILDTTGKPIKVVGTRGKGPDEFDYVHGVAIASDGTIYVTDSYNNRLSAYDRNGKRLWIERTGNPTNGADVVNNMMAAKEATDTKLQGANTLQLPLGLTIDGAGRLVVSDMYESALAVFDAKTGKFIAKYGDAGADDGQFFYPVSVGYDPGRDWFTVADAMNRRVEIVRIPNSAGTGAVAAVVNRSLASPLRACVLPLLLILLAIIVGVIVRAMRRRRAQSAAGAASGGEQSIQGAGDGQDGALEVGDDAL